MKSSQPHALDIDSWETTERIDSIDAKVQRGGLPECMTVCPGFRTGE
jgi:hypothetical protein